MQLNISSLICIICANLNLLTFMLFANAHPKCCDNACMCRRMYMDVPDEHHARVN
jgi:hypothetical protein